MISTRTAYDLVYQALRETGTVSLGDTLDDNVAQEALLVLNAIRAEHSLNVKNYYIFDQTFQAPINRTNITLGTSVAGPGDIAIRPQNITQVTVISGSPLGAAVNYTVPIRPYEEYRALTLQNIFAIPQFAYIDNSYPLQNIWFYPGLSAGWYVRVLGMSYLIEYENLSDPYIDPPEWFSPLYLELGLRLCGRYGTDPTTGLVEQHSGAWKHIKAHMFSSRLKRAPNGLKTPTGASFSFYAGQ